MNPPFMFKYVRLNEGFYLDYPNSEYKEILIKDFRPYLHISVSIDDLTYILPFRSNVTHGACFKFNLHSDDRRAIDFSKAIVINDWNRYIESYQKNIPQAQHDLITEKISTILRQFKQYIKNYKKAVVKQDINAMRRYRVSYSSLQYFHQEMGLDTDL